MIDTAAHSVDNSRNAMDISRTETDIVREVLRSQHTPRSQRIPEYEGLIAQDRDWED